MFEKRQKRKKKKKNDTFKIYVVLTFNVVYNCLKNGVSLIRHVFEYLNFVFSRYFEFF